MNSYTAQQLSDWAELAYRAVSAARPVFRRGHGRAVGVRKPDGSLCTDADLAIESQLREMLAGESGFPLFGEEQGGELGDQPTWVVDPIDGTSNFAAGNPLCAILVSLVIGGQPVVAITDIPMLELCLSGVAGGPLLVNGHPPEATQGSCTEMIGFGSVVSPLNAVFPTRRRLAIIAALSDTYPSLRVTGSVGCDLAFAAQGVFRAAVSFSPKAWDNAAGVLLARSAGLMVTDIAGRPWHATSNGVLVGAPEIHATIVDTITSSS